MPRPIQFAVQSTTVSPTQLYGMVTAKDYLQARLDELGGPSASITALSADADRAKLIFEHSVPAEKLPSIARSLISGELRIDRTETWTRSDDEEYLGTVVAGIAGTPARIEGSMRITLLNGGAQLRGTGQVTVSIPLIGGKVESAVAEQVNKLLAAEADFTAQWLSAHA